METKDEQINNLLNKNKLLLNKQLEISTKYKLLCNYASQLCRAIQISDSFDKYEYKELVDSILDNIGLPNVLSFDDGTTGYYWQTDALEKAKDLMVIWDSDKKLWLTVPYEKEKSKSK